MKEFLGLCFLARIATLVLKMYNAARRIVFGRSVSIGEQFIQGVLVGCSFATTMIKAYFLRCYEQLIKDHLAHGSALKLFINDSSASRMVFFSVGRVRGSLILLPTSPVASVMLCSFR